MLCDDARGLGRHVESSVHNCGLEAVRRRVREIPGDDSAERARGRRTDERVLQLHGNGGRPQRRLGTEFHVVLWVQDPVRLPNLHGDVLVSAKPAKLSQGVRYDARQDDVQVVHHASARTRVSSPRYCETVTSERVLYKNINILLNYLKYESLQAKSVRVQTSLTNT